MMQRRDFRSRKKNRKWGESTKTEVHSCSCVWGTACSGSKSKTRPRSALDKSPVIGFGAAGWGNLLHSRAWTTRAEMPSWAPALMSAGAAAAAV